MESPVGRLTLVAGERALVAVLWENDPPGRVRLDPGSPGKGHPIFCQAEQELSEYFAGVRQRFSVPIEFTGTDFQQKVWRAMAAIPFGRTRSYGQLAADIGSPAASRAVGAANGKNPISIIAPCHRVIGASGALTGFAGGIAAKSFLLAHEAWYSLAQPPGQHATGAGDACPPAALSLAS